MQSVKENRSFRDPVILPGQHYDAGFFARKAGVRRPQTVVLAVLVLEDGRVGDVQVCLDWVKVLPLPE